MLLAGVAVDGELSRIDGAILVAAYAVAVVYLWRLGRRGVAIEAEGEAAEELARELPAARRGHPELAVGNVAGSMLAFFAFNAGVAALVQPIDVPDRLITTQIPIVLATVVAVTWLLARNAVGRAGGALLVGWYAAFLISLA